MVNTAGFSFYSVIIDNHWENIVGILTVTSRNKECYSAQYYRGLGKEYFML